MAAIGSIRKHGVLMMIVIGFALVLFLLTGLFDGNTLNRFIHGDQYTRGKIDGQYVDERYATLYEELTVLYKILNDKNTLEEAETYFIHELTWEQLLTEITLNKEFESLGIIYTDEAIEVIMDEVFATLSTQQPNNYLIGYYSYLAKMRGEEFAQQVLMSIRDLKDQPDYADLYYMYKVIQDRIVFESKMNTYRGFAMGTMNFSDELAKKIATENKTMTAQLMSINPQHASFAEIDATVSEKEMKNWYNENKFRYNNLVETRDIDIALFPIIPTNTDKQNIENEIREKFENLQSTTLDSFNRAQMFQIVDSSYHKAGSNLIVNTTNGYIALDVIDTLEKIIFNSAPGDYIEPYNHEDQIWFYGQTFGTAQRSDSILVALLFVDYKSQQNPNGTRTKKEARLEADSVKNVILNGEASVFELLPNYLGGRNATDTTLWISEDDFRGNIDLYSNLLETPVGGVYVENNKATAYNIFQVLAKTDPIIKKQYALYAADIIASDETINSLRSQAQQLASASSTTEEFHTEANNAGVQVMNGNAITPMATSINQMPGFRSVVYWAFNENTAKNAVSDIFKLDNGYFAVATVVEKHPQGTPKFEDVKDAISAEMTHIKKVELVKEKIAAEIAAGKSMKDVASAYGSIVMDSVKMTYLGEQGQNRGVDNGATGEMFAKSSNNGVQTIAGKDNVYVFAAGSVVDGAQPSETLQQEKFLLRNIFSGRGMRNEYMVITGLRKNIEILDNRGRLIP
ncbi:SurA N-terminal domain-containing protein [Bacteroidales bacterium OttesenSCG-928-B11]|nr:SurA N-terminal domain-containing protein [Bacteroidales bacterium OttesenSCG-928-E04]MDL2311355.1 SurA N-terminal domain-containing protein [Bacteroidales bacterium OttesenSCG-928-B11]